MITLNDIDVILSIPVSPVYINALVLFNGKSLPSFVNHTNSLLTCLRRMYFRMEWPLGFDHVFGL